MLMIRDQTFIQYVWQAEDEFSATEAPADSVTTLHEDTTETTDYTVTEAAEYGDIPEMTEDLDVIQAVDDEDGSELPATGDTTIRNEGEVVLEDLHSSLGSVAVDDQAANDTLDEEHIGIASETPSIIVDEVPE